MEIILLKYGELVLKGANRHTFEAMLTKDIRRRGGQNGGFSVRTAQSTVYVEPTSDASDIDEMMEDAAKVFGISALERACVTEKDIEQIINTAVDYCPDKLRGAKTFKVEAKRADKSFPYGSPEIAAKVGEALLNACPWLSVSVTSPEIVVRVEVRDKQAFVAVGQEKGAGGMPYGSSGRGLLLLSGGIDSPVAGYMMAKRGMKIDALHFESYPYTGELALEKVKTLAEILGGYCPGMQFHTASVTKIQEELRKSTNEDYFTLLLRRAMMRIASDYAKKLGCGVLITGESLGQVASQTMEAIAVTEDAASLPVFRPCIGLDKEEIVKIARKIGTFETSILPYEDCCTVFTPRHPKTRPALEKVVEQEHLIIK